MDPHECRPRTHHKVYVAHTYIESDVTHPTISTNSYESNTKRRHFWSGLPLCSFFSQESVFLELDSPVKERKKESPTTISRWTFSRGPILMWVKWLKHLLCSQAQFLHFYGPLLSQLFSLMRNKTKKAFEQKKNSMNSFF